MGTPAQDVRLQIDTGSSDLWVNTPTSSLCEEGDNPCASAGTYSANSSSTYAYVGSWFNISYVDGSGASGDYATDTVTVGSSTVDSLQFGIGYTSSSSQGILGIGYPENEAQVGTAGKSSYDNLPAALVSSSQISRNAYSLWLNDIDANSGSILFGGVDTDQYTGSLSTLPIQANGGVYSEFLITLTSISLSNTTIQDSMALAVLLDSGSSLSYLPDSIANSIFNKVGAEYDPDSESAYVPCSIADSSSKMAFDFSGVKISVPMDELVLDIDDRLKFSNGEAACLFGIAPAGTSTSVLGDTFLRSAYVVYDIANNQISLAQTNFNATSTNVVAIPTGSSIPDATTVANPIAATDGVSSDSDSTTRVDNAAPAPGEMVSSAVLLATLLAAGSALFTTALL
ncbi:eukaryotic aspartyl protease [Xylariaceae sp. FL0255]|nr:eukaryotic aspartyl protease [Xylariaceae sp. FL0255]